MKLLMGNWRDARVYAAELSFWSDFSRRRRAYLAGFWLAECGVLLLNRNPDISTWLSARLHLSSLGDSFSMYRRHVIQSEKWRPDMTHLHHLYLNQLTGAQSKQELGSTRLISLKIWLFFSDVSSHCHPFHRHDLYLFWSALAFATIYTATYARHAKPTRHLNSELGELTPYNNP